MPYDALVVYATSSAFIATILKNVTWNCDEPRWKRCLRWVVWFLFWPILVTFLL